MKGGLNACTAYQTCNRSCETAVYCNSSFYHSRKYCLSIPFFLAISLISSSDQRAIRDPCGCNIGSSPLLLFLHTPIVRVLHRTSDCRDNAASHSGNPCNSMGT